MTMLLDKAEQLRLAEATGHSWAESKAETLEGAISAIHWPSDWDRSWMHALPFKRGEVLTRDLHDLTELAIDAAAEHWARLVAERRTEEFEAELTFDEEARANRLLETLSPALPWQIVADRDGPEVYLTDRWGQEWPVLSEEQAWRALSEWREHCSS